MIYGKLHVNILSNIGYYSFSILINIWFTPYLIRHLGVASYGIIPLATTVVSYLSVLTLVLNAAVGRFITVNLEKGCFEEANEFFNTSLVSSLLFVAVIIAPCLVLAFRPQWLFRLPEGQNIQTTLLFMCTLAMFMLAVISTPFDVATFCKNRFDIRNAIAIISSLVRVLVVIALFNFGRPEIWHVGVGILVASLVSLLGSLWAWKKLAPQLSIDFQLFSVKTLRELVGTGGWIAVSQVGTILLLSIDLLVVNRLLGSESVGQYASLMQWSALLRGLGTTVAGVLAPTIIYYFARDEIDLMVASCRQAVKFLGLFLALPVGLISGLAKPLLCVWLGPDFVPLAPLMLVMTAHLGLTLGFMPLHNISTATNNVRIPGLFQVAMGILNLLLAVLFAGPIGWGMYGVATAGAVVLVLRNVVFTPLYAAKIINKSPGAFIAELFPIVFVGALVTMISWFIASCFDLNSWIKLFTYSFSFSFLYYFIAWFLFTNENEKVMLKKILHITR